MPLNQNPFVKEILSWQGHDKAGVRVPFSQIGGNPLHDDRGKSRIVETRLITKLRQLALSISQGDELCPRYLFLLGGSGNGKSEGIQDFAVELDKHLGCNGELVSLLREKFRPDPLVKWSVEVTTEDFAKPSAGFSEKVGRLILIQDASASESPDRDAAAELVDYVLDLVTVPKKPYPVFVCCANRGLLARALKEAVSKGTAYMDVANLFRSMIRSITSGPTPRSGDALSCWPLGLHGKHPLFAKVACWPLDAESLLTSTTTTGRSAIEEVFLEAAGEHNWELATSCSSCDSNNLCPFRYNAMWLRDAASRRGLITILRHAELATGKRWKFRDLFSLAAELVVGDRANFTRFAHPCKWVHQHAADIANSTDSESKVMPVFDLVQRLLPNVIFPLDARQRTFAAKVLKKAANYSLTSRIAECTATSSVDTGTYLRQVLYGGLANMLDPALLSPHDENSALGAIEDLYNQSVSQGNTHWEAMGTASPLERDLAGLLNQAEGELDSLGRESAVTLLALNFLKTLGASLAKRSIGTRTGTHALIGMLSDYESTIRDNEKLHQLTGDLRSLLRTDPNRFRMNATETLGQPHSHATDRIELEAELHGIEPFEAAPGQSESKPAHDLPYTIVQGYPLPLTFDLFHALVLRKAGCRNSSLPASVRAAMDRIRHLLAGSKCRDDKLFVSQDASYLLPGRKKLTLGGSGDIPRLRNV